MKRLMVLGVVCLLFCGVASASMVDHRYDLKLLLHGNLEPTAYSTTDFRDSSRAFQMPYARTNTTLGGFVDVNSTQKKYGNASIFLNAPTPASMRSNLTITDNPAYTFGTNNFSISMWVYWPTAWTRTDLYRHATDTNNYDQLATGVVSNQVIFNRYRSSASIGSVTATVPTFVAGKWYQIAVIGNGTDTQVYVNGTSYGTVARTASATDLTGVIQLSDVDIAGAAQAQFMDEVVITNGGFAPSIQDLQGEWPLYLNGTPYGGYADDDYTRSLIHFDGINDGTGNFTDKYANRSWTRSAPLVTATNASRFGATGAYFGNGGYLTTPYSADFDMGTGDWSADGVVSLDSSSPASDARIIYAGTYPVAYLVRAQPTGISLLSNASGSWATDATVSTTITPGTKYHIGVVRSGTSVKFYKDGTLLETDTIPAGYQYNTYENTTLIQGYNCTMDEVRITKGLARDFSVVPVDPYELIANHTWTPTPDAAGTIPATIQFNDTTPSGAWTVNTYNWSFGDAGGYSSLQNPSHVYSATGLFSATGNVFNNNMTSALTKTVPIGAPNVAYACTPLTGTAALTVTCTDLTTNYTPITSYLMDFGDGTTSTDTPPWIHVYATYGSFSTNLTETNSVGEGYEYKRDYIVVSTPQNTVLENFQPQTIQFSFVDSKNNRVLNAPVNASVVTSSFPSGSNWLVDLYAVDADAANEMLNGTLQMQGSTDNTGSIVFTMQPSLEYNISILVPSTGITQNRLLYPIERQYTIHLVGTAVNNSYMDTGYNTSLYVYEPNASYATFELAYQDMSGRTTLLEYYLVDRNNATPLLINYQSTAAIGTNTVRMNYTLPNVRGQRFSWYYNAVRTL